MFPLRKKNVLPEIYAGHSGVHMTAYLPIIDGNFSRQRKEIKKIIHKVESLLKKEKDEAFIKKFVHPLKQLVDSPKFFDSNSSGTWALFRTRSYFRLKRIPVKLPRLCVVADSFHIKPILKWIQSRQECYVLSLSSENARLLELKSGNLKEIDSVPTVGVLNTNQENSEFHRRILRKMDDWVSTLTSDKSLPILLVGDPKATIQFEKTSSLPLIHQNADFENNFSVSDSALSARVLLLLKQNFRRTKRESIKELTMAKKNGTAIFDLHEISRLAVNRKISRLYIAEDRHVWGVMDSASGSLTVHPHQKNCSDDDLLDDLAELALKNGAEIVLLPSSDMPGQLPIAAIRKKRPPKPILLPSPTPLQLGAA